MKNSSNSATCIVIIVPADSLAPLWAKLFAGATMNVCPTLVKTWKFLNSALELDEIGSHIIMSNGVYSS